MHATNIRDPEGIPFALPLSAFQLELAVMGTLEAANTSR